jgi:riboflavin synthase
MFTGIIQELGTITRRKEIGGGIQLTVHAPQSASELAIDDSVSINGCCQTVVGKNGNEFTVEAVEETLKKTTFSEFTDGTRVNLELAMRLNDRLGGHLVLGHVDGVGSIKSIEEKGSSWLFAIRVPKEFLQYVIPVGSIAIDGVSLTVARLHENDVTVSIIPHTYENTTFGFLKAGTNVNIEFDLIGKYIERLMKSESSGSLKSTLSAEKLREWGYEK